MSVFTKIILMAVTIIFALGLLIASLYGAWTVSEGNHVAMMGLTTVLTMLIAAGTVAVLTSIEEAR